MKQSYAIDIDVCLIVTEKLATIESTIFQLCEEWKYLSLLLIAITLLSISIFDFDWCLTLEPSDSPHEIVSPAQLIILPIPTRSFRPSSRHHSL